MRILLVGAGGVGTRLRPHRRPPRFRRTDRRRLRPGPGPARRGGQGRLHAPSSSTPGTRPATAALLTEHRCDVLMNATDPRFVMPLFRAALRPATPTIWTWRCRCPSRIRPSPTARPGSSSATSSSRWPMQWEQRRASWRWSGWASSRACPTCSPGTRPTSCSARSTSSASGTAPTWWSPATTSRRPSPSGPRSRSASTRRSSGRRTAAGSPPRRSASRRSSTSRPASARSSASTSSTKRCC